MPACDRWEKRRYALFGKGMIVVMSRRIAVRLYEKITELRPHWHSADPEQGKIKVVMTGSAADGGWARTAKPMLVLALRSQAWTTSSNLPAISSPQRFPDADLANAWCIAASAQPSAPQIQPVTAH